MYEDWLNEFQLMALQIRKFPPNSSRSPSLFLNQVDKLVNELLPCAWPPKRWDGFGFASGYWEPFRQSLNCRAPTKSRRTVALYFDSRRGHVDSAERPACQYKANCSLRPFGRNDGWHLLRVLVNLTHASWCS